MTVSKTYDCAVIGGGFTGLAAAADIARAGRSVIVLEKETALGGLAA
ncbi:MAG: FAD-dependent oxidoreductase, partial [Albidovulum sp.]